MFVDLLYLGLYLVCIDFSMIQGFLRTSYECHLGVCSCNWDKEGALRAFGSSIIRREFCNG
jgi:hypothetical protein